MYKTSDFFYDLPEELIAQTPVEPRNSSRLLKVSRETGEIKHDHFYNLCDYLKKGDLLILNDSRVLPARLYGVKCDNNTFIEFLLLEQKGNMTWDIICRPAKKAKIGTEFSFGDGKLIAKVIGTGEDGNRTVEFRCDGNFFATLDEIGQMPLPPYIKEKLENKERYQTVYSREIGSAAAPTAGLHFTPEQLEQIKSMGVDIAYVTLHVGLGTFRPVKVASITEHHMHSEHYYMPSETSTLIAKAKKNGNRVISVGTTSCRTLESVAEFYGSIEEGREYDGYTDIFIYPPHEFKVIDGLITNFHLPESTLIMLVSAFLGYENTMKTYETAVKEKYRFFSFGDSMAIL